MRHSLLITGTLTEPDPLNPGQFVRVCYQRAPEFACNYTLPDGTRLQRRIIRKSTKPATPSLLLSRQKFRAAMAAWSNTTMQQREELRPRAKIRNILIHNLFITDWYTANKNYQPPAPPYTATSGQNPVAAYSRGGKIRTKQA